MCVAISTKRLSLYQSPSVHIKVPIKSPIFMLRLRQYVTATTRNSPQSPYNPNHSLTRSLSNCPLSLLTVHLQLTLNPFLPPIYTIPRIQHSAAASNYIKLPPLVNRTRYKLSSTRYINARIITSNGDSSRPMTMLSLYYPLLILYFHYYPLTILLLSLLSLLSLHIHFLISIPSPYQWRIMYPYLFLLLPPMPTQLH